MADKRDRGEGTILERKRHSDGTSSWRLRYRVNGTRYSATFQGSKTDARKELRRLLKSGDDGEHIAPAKITMSQWVEKWVALLERRQDGEEAKRGRGAIGARTLERYQELMRLHVLPKLGSRPLQKITATEIDTLYVALEEKLAASTVRYVHVVLGACLGMAVRKELIKANPVTRAEPPANGDSDIGQVLEQPELDKLVGGFRASTLYPIVCVAAYTGARRNEILALRWSDLDIERKTLKIARAIDETKKHGRGLKEPKSERGKRTIAIDDGLISLLRGERERHQRIKAGVPDGAPSGTKINISLVKLPDDALMFPAAPGEGEDFSFTRLRTPRNVTKEFHRKAGKLGFKIRFHDLRGTHGTLLLDAGVAVHTVAARLGHDPAVLLHSYAKRTKKGDTTAADVIGTLSKNVLG